MSIGIHAERTNGISITGSITETFNRIPKSKCIQIFTYGPKSNHMNKFSTEDLKEKCRQHRVYVHGSYVLPWTDMSPMQEQLRVADSLGALGMVVHLTKGITPAEYATKLSTLQYGRCRILLEMKALKAGTRWGYQSAAELVSLATALRTAGIGPDKVQICIDTAHVDAGRIPLREADDMRTYLNDLQTVEDYIGLFHLNGNVYDCTKRAGDKHTIPCAADDKIWGDMKYSDSGCCELIEYAAKKNIDCIVEMDLSDELVTFCNGIL